MATAIVWKNVAVAMQSAIAAAKTIISISQANPGVVNATAHGYSDGDYVMLEVQGMYQVNQRVVRVANKTTDTFELEGINTTDFEAFSSGTAKEITFGTSISSATTISASGGNFDMIDTTTIHQNFRSEMPGLPQPISYSMDHIWDSADAGQIAMKAASDIQALRAFKFTFGSGGKILVFVGYVGFAGLPGGSAQNLITCQAVFTMNGLPTFYAS
jgi:hypothetical protein